MAKGQRDIYKQIEAYTKRYEDEKGYPATEPEKNFIKNFFMVGSDGAGSIAEMEELFPMVISHRRKFILKSALLRQKKEKANFLKGEIANLKACKSLSPKELSEYGITPADIAKLPELEKQYSELLEETKPKQEETQTE